MRNSTCEKYYFVEVSRHYNLKIKGADKRHIGI